MSFFFFGDESMELQEQVTQLTNEKNHYVKLIDGINAEKTALDQMFVKTLQDMLTIKRDMILTNAECEKVKSELAALKAEKSQLQNRLDALSKPHEVENEILECEAELVCNAS